MKIDPNHKSKGQKWAEKEFNRYMNYMTTDIYEQQDQEGLCEAFKADLYARCFASLCEKSKNVAQAAREPRDHGFATLDERDLPELFREF